MEILHRRSRPTNSNNGHNSSTPSNGSSSSSPPRVVVDRIGTATKTSSIIKARPITTENPYHQSSSGTDVLLVRCIQLLLTLTVIWFIYVIAVINSPSLDTTPITTENGDDGLGGNMSSSIGMSNLRGPSDNIMTNHLPAAINPDEIQTARTNISKLREEFYTRYGGKEIATTMLNKGVRTFENKNTKDTSNSISIRATANRFLSAIVRHEYYIPLESSQQQQRLQQQKEQAEFVMAFAGYSVTVGRGNHLEQSYPFVLEKILSPILQLSPFNTKLIVRNSAIGGIPSFPYGWCLSNFLGDDSDLVSWDYGMNEGNGATGLESYLRQALLMPKSPPLFVLLDVKSGKRLNMLQKYVDLGVLPDPIALGNKEAVDKKLLQLPENERPIGLQKWDEWGAPKGAPGQSPWHPKKQEHALMGWMLAMHMLDALDDALTIIEQDASWRTPLLAKERKHKEVALPPPVADVSNTGVASILHGSSSETNKNEWRMNHISCRTSFLPNISGNLNSIIVSGIEKSNKDIMEPRDDSEFLEGWVMDVGKLERDTKLKVLKYGGLGYIDMKTALYGIPSSGMLQLFLPYEGRSGSGENSIRTQPVADADATKYFNTIVLCEVNEKRGDNECKMTSDLDFRIGNVAVSKSNVSQVKDVASYLKKDICIRVEIPKDAKLSNNLERVGLSLDVTVTGTGITRENGACSISHVIWENI